MMRFLLVFLAGLLLGANFVYFAMHRAGARAVVVAAQPPATLPVAPTATATSRDAQPGKAPPLPSTPSTGASIAPATPDATMVPATTDAPAATRGLLLPVAGVGAAQLVDTYTDARGEGRVHDAIDIMSPRGTPVLATAEGSVAKLFTSKAGGLTIYEFDPTSTWVYYYAHLDRYADGLAEGQALHRGQVIGYVGSTGNASPDAPHLHFEISKLGPEKHWWQASPVNPYPLLGGKPH